MVQQHPETAKVIPIRPKAKEEAVGSISTAESPHFSEAFLWINSESPDTTEPTGREKIPEIVAYLYERYRVSLAEAIALVHNWRNGEECDDSLSAPEIVTLEYRFAAAREHARNQTRVFAVDPNGKKPAFVGWQAGATTDEQRFRRWLTENPEYNLGTPTDELLVIDVDPKNGGSIDALLAMGPLPDTQVSETPSGGTHYIFDLPAEVSVPNSVGKLARGIDVRGRGGLIVLPGSTINGCDYHWVEGYSPKERKRALAPDWLIELAKKGSKSGKKSEYAGKRLVEEDDEIVRRARDYIENHAPEAIEGNGGDQTTYDVACDLFDIGASKETVTDLMHRYNEIKCFPIWEADDIVKKVDNAMRYKQNPTGVKATPSGFPSVEIDESKRPPHCAKAESKDDENKRALSKEKEEGEPLFEMFYEAAAKALTESANPLVKGLLDRGALSTWYGPPKTGKTFTLLWLACCVASGTAFAGHKTRRGAVLYIAMEGTGGILKRLEALRLKYPELDLSAFAIMRRKADLVHRRSEGLKLIIEACAQLAEKTGLPVELVVIDTVARAMGGDSDSDPGAMGTLIDSFDAIRAATGAHLAAIHHTSKANPHAARGYGGLLGALDSEFEIQRGLLKATNMREAEDGIEWGIVLEPVVLGEDEDGEPITSRVATIRDRKEMQIGLTAQEAEVFEVIQ